MRIPLWMTLKRSPGVLLQGACHPVQDGTGDKANRGGCDQRASQVPAAKSAESGEYISEVSVLYIRCRRIQAIRRTARDIVDCLRPLAPRLPYRRGGRVQCVRSLMARRFQFLAGGPA
jgi:hypothetical protein